MVRHALVVPTQVTRRWGPIIRSSNQQSPCMTIATGVMGPRLREDDNRMANRRTHIRHRPIAVLAAIGLLAAQIPATALGQGTVAASPYDGDWEFVGVGDGGGDCNGSIVITISGGKLIGKDMDGSVSPAGVLTASGTRDGKSVLSTGKLKGLKGFGSFKRSDGCRGRWIATKQESVGSATNARRTPALVTR
jgi:hypothetical protein